jgi:hypothetical protein
MGLLDDAIREHLDLKRRRGADPAEVARLEQEALGPVRREPAPAEAAKDAAADEGAEAPPAEQHAHVLAPEDRHEPPHGDPLFEHPADERAEAAEPHPAPPHGAPAEPEPDEQPEPEPERPTQPEQAAVVDQPTTEYRVEDEHRDSDDVLEETPDFLQETPEHDRLWFEQRPPRDFDFDG